MRGMHSHLEQAETGLETLNRGVSPAGLRPPERCMFSRESRFKLPLVDLLVHEIPFSWLERCVGQPRELYRDEDEAGKS